MMKDKRRALMKAFTMIEITTIGLVSIGLGESLAINTRLLTTGNIPHWCWRWDKPKLDKRRYRRYLAGSHVLP